MAIIQGNAKQGSTRGFYPKVINGSLRFNDDDSAYLSWTPASAGNRKTWTWSGWVKRGNTNAISTLMSAESSVDVTDSFLFLSTGQLYFNIYNLGVQSNLQTSAVYRDPSAWYHIVIAYDTTQATSSNRVKLYVNGEQVTSFSNAVYPSQNYENVMNSTVAHSIGRREYYGQYLDGYLANVHFIDGQGLTASDFGETKNGVWVAKDYAGTFGTNGFYLTFEDDTQVEAFNTVLWRGDGSSTGQSITGVGFQPDLIWVKNRSITASHALVDSVRGSDSMLFSNATNAEDTTNYGIEFTQDGFETGNVSNTNYNGSSFVAWCWKAGDSNVSNTDGSITSTVRANDTYGFSIVSYTGNGSASQTVGHGLGSAPSGWFVIVKNRTNATNWAAWHSAIPSGRLKLNATDADLNSYPITFDTDTITLPSVNDIAWSASAQNYIAYCWSETTGYSKFGSYTGTGSAGNAVTGLGFTPAFVMIKNTTDANTEWMMFDNTRDTNVGDVDSYLKANASSAETTDNANVLLSFDSDGFTVDGGGNDTNGNGDTFIYAAFADTREAAFWLDQSGNDNDWQPVNLDHNDTVADSPTNNFATLNPLTGGSSTTSNGNLEATIAPINGARVSTFAVNSGKWYCEMTPTTIAGYFVVGIGAPYSKGWNSTQEANAKGIVWASATGTLINTGSWSFSSSTVSTTYTTNDVLGIALDMDSNTIEFFKNGSSVGSATISVDQDVSFLIGNSSGVSNGAGSVNFGQLGFTYTPPTGYLALSTANLPDPVIDPAQDASPEDYFNTVLYSGSASAQSITGVGFQPDFVWIKKRSDANSHNLVDVVRGADKRLYSNSTVAEADNTGFSFDSDGFTVTTSGSQNESGYTFVGWNWKANGSGVSNTDGSITSTVSANTTSGFSIVKWTSDSSTAEIGHGLGVIPDMIIIKNLDGSEDWRIAHAGLPDMTYHMNFTSQGSFQSGTAIWNGAPTSTVFKTGTDASVGGTSNNDMIAYCFHSVEGFSKFGSYEGNASSNGPFIYCGFRPAWLMVKNIDYGSTSSDWVIHDNKRNAYNLADHHLEANTSNAEDGDARPIDVDFLSNGFKIRTDGSYYENNNTQTYIYMAFAENPFKYSNAR